MAKKGYTPWNKGLTGIVCGVKKGSTSPLKGIKTGRVPKTAFKKGTISAFAGRNHNKETKKRISIARIGKSIGEDRYNWKGSKVSYGALHTWIRKVLGKIKECVYCGNEGRIEWASISHKAKRDINDFIPLCVPCHRAYDRKAVS